MDAGMAGMSPDVGVPGWGVGIGGLPDTRVLTTSTPPTQADRCRRIGAAREMGTPPDPSWKCRGTLGGGGGWDPSSHRRTVLPPPPPRGP